VGWDAAAPFRVPGREFIGAWAAGTWVRVALPPKNFKVGVADRTEDAFWVPCVAVRRWPATQPTATSASTAAAARGGIKAGLRRYQGMVRSAGTWIRFRTEVRKAGGVESVGRERSNRNCCSYAAAVSRHAGQPSRWVRRRRSSAGVSSARRASISRKRRCAVMLPLRTTLENVRVPVRGAGG
jgi:hypothetical protein